MTAARLVYPDSDGELLADNTEHFTFIMTVQGNLDALRTDFVAGDHLWYPVEGHPEIRVAPDVYVAQGRPKGRRGSYKQWEEGGTPLTVVFEWWSPNSTFPKEVAKLRFYEKYGVAEFYAWDEVRRIFTAYVRTGGELAPVDVTEGFTSPILGIRMVVERDELVLYRPDGQRFRTFAELSTERDAAAAERDAAVARANALAEKLRALGIDPDAD